jgi:hypothetical protein
VSVNATCGEGVAGKEVYCKLVGYDTFGGGGMKNYDILDGHVSSAKLKKPKKPW